MPKRVVEIRIYRLHPGSGERLDALVRETTVPMLRRWGTDVVSFSLSAHAPDHYCLIRAYDDGDDRVRRQDAFYGSPEWREGPRAAILDCIESYLDTVLSLSEAAIVELRSALPGPNSPSP